MLFSNISDEERRCHRGAAVAAQYPLTASTRQSVIMVPASQVHEVRMKLAQQGLPKEWRRGL